MELLKSKFESALKTKLLYKTSGHMTEAILLLKNFKYFDDEETNNCNVDTFLKVVAKVGVLSFSEEELIQIFNQYSKGKKYLNYKDFVSLIFNNESLKDNSMKKEEVQDEVVENQEIKEPTNEKRKI